MNGTATGDSSILIEPILGPDYGRLCVDTSKGCSLQTPTYFFLCERTPWPAAWGEERNMKTPGPLGKHQSPPVVLLWENYESDSQTHEHTHTKRRLRDSLSQKLYFKTYLDGSMAVPGAHALPSWKLREWFSFTSSLWPNTSRVGSGRREVEEEEEEEAVVNHSEMVFLSCSTLTLSFFPSLFFPCIFSTSSGAVWVCADSRGRGGERHPESASSVKASHPPPPHLLLARWAPVSSAHSRLTSLSALPSPRSVSLFCLCLLSTSIYTVYLWMSCQISHLDPYSQRSRLRVQLLI